VTPKKAQVKPWTEIFPTCINYIYRIASWLGGMLSQPGSCELFRFNVLLYTTVMDINIQSKLDKFFSTYKRQMYRPNEILIRAEVEPKSVFYLTEGIVRMYAVSAQGEEVVINIYRPVSFFPMNWVLNDSISHYYFEATTPVTTLKAPKDKFLKFLKSEPEVLFDLVKRIYKGLEGYFLRMEYLMSGSAKSRLITEILISAKRFGKNDGRKVVVSLKMTEKDLAAQTGITRETVSREIHKLREKGLINFEKNTLTVIDILSLEDELSLV